VEKVVLIRPSG